MFSCSGFRMRPQNKMTGGAISAKIRRLRALLLYQRYEAGRTNSRAASTSKREPTPPIQYHHKHNIITSMKLTLSFSRVLTIKRGVLIGAAALFVVATLGFRRTAHDCFPSTIPKRASALGNLRHGGEGAGGLESTVLLVALQDGPAGGIALRHWSDYLGAFNATQSRPSVWILCPTVAMEASVREMPHLRPLLVGDNPGSWAELLTSFLLPRQGVRSIAPSVVGLFGEGSLPNRDLDLASLIGSMQPALTASVPPTAIVARSRSLPEEGGAGGGEWLSDKFVSQVWCNRAFLANAILTGVGIEQRVVQDLSLLEVLSQLLRGNSGSHNDAVLVDGTHVLRSISAETSGSASLATNPKHATSARGMGSNPQQVPAPPASRSSPSTTEPAAVGVEASSGSVGQGEADMYIGALEFALVYDGVPDSKGNAPQDDGQPAQVRPFSIAKAPWPPEYLLETVATEEGLVIVSDANCGYLNMASNLLMSIRRTSDAKVLFVAMDQVSFDFMDAMSPGCTATFPADRKARHLTHGTKAGIIGDKKNASEVLARPRILGSVLRQGYAVLWTDADVVWLGNPLPLLPIIKDDSASDVMLQNDGSTKDKGICFMFLNPTPKACMLLDLWEQRMIDLRVSTNQAALKKPLEEMLHAGMQLQVPSKYAFPAGKDFFDHAYAEGYATLYHPKATIVHINWNRGNAAKTRLFQDYHVWDVGGTVFPDCPRR